MAYISSYTGAQIDTCVGSYQNSTQVQTAITNAINTAIANVKLALFPVGSIYTSTSSTDPGTFIGGTWEQITDTFLLAAGSTYTAGDTGGEATHTLTTSEIPAHTHSRGTMEITGMIATWTDYNTGNTSFDSQMVSGAFHFKTGTDWESGVSTNASSGSNDAMRKVNFTASKTWSGATSSVGSDGAHNNMPPYLVVYVWKRTA